MIRKDFPKLLNLLELIRDSERKYVLTQKLGNPKKGKVNICL